MFSVPPSLFVLKKKNNFLVHLTEPSTLVSPFPNALFYPIFPGRGKQLWMSLRQFVPHLRHSEFSHTCSWDRSLFFTKIMYNSLCPTQQENIPAGIIVAFIHFSYCVFFHVEVRFRQAVINSRALQAQAESVHISVISENLYTTNYNQVNER